MPNSAGLYRTLVVLFDCTNEEGNMRITDITTRKVNAETKVRWAAYGRVSSKSIEQLHSNKFKDAYYAMFFA